MDINQFSIYSVVTQSETNNEEKLKVVLAQLEKLNKFNTEKEVKAYIQETWGIKDDVSNYPIGQNIELSMSSGKKYYNITVKASKEVKSYNYNK